MAYIHEKPNGTFLVRISNGIKDGKQVQYGFTYHPPYGATKAKIKAEVKKLAEEMERLVKSGSFIPGEKGHVNQSYNPDMLVKDFIPNIYYPAIKKKLSPNTYKLYVTVCEQSIIPSLGKMRLCDITNQHRQMFIDFLAYECQRKDGSDAHGLAPGTVKRYATIFSSVMTEAWNCGIIKEHPFKDKPVQFPKIHKKRIVAYSADEAKKFLAALNEEPVITRLILSIALMLGLRRAEIVALKWSDVNFDNHSIDINKSAYKAKGEKQSLKPPKSECGYRTVNYPEYIDNLLHLWKEEQVDKNIESDDDFIFTNEKGEWISLYTLTRMCDKFEKRHDLRHLHLHGLRHTCGSLLMSMGTDAETVRDILGHESFRTTNIYLHPYESKKRDAAVALGELLGENNEK